MKLAFLLFLLLLYNKFTLVSLKVRVCTHLFVDVSMTNHITAVVEAFATYGATERYFFCMDATVLRQVILTNTISDLSALKCKKPLHEPSDEIFSCNLRT